MGNSVLVPSFTFVATANAVEYTGARPVFVDIDPATFTINPGEILKNLQTRHIHSQDSPKCILPVSLFGLCADMEKINSIAREHDMIVVEDAACGLGAKRMGRHAGAEALAGCLSFHPRKVITTGEGGMVVTNNDIIAEKIRRMRNHGAGRTDLERHLKEGGSLLPEYDELGYNYRMTDLQGALGVAQMQKLEKILKAREAAAGSYVELLKDMPEFKTPAVPQGYQHAFQSFVCLFAPGLSDLSEIGDLDEMTLDDWNRRRNKLMSNLERDGISVRQGTHAVHTLGYYKKKYALRNSDFPMSLAADRLSIALPLYADISEEEQARVVECIRRELPTI